MKRFAAICILLGVYLWIAGLSLVWSQSTGKVVITAPADGAVLHEPIIELILSVDKGMQGDNVHIYVDGKFEAIVKGDRYPLKGLPAGEHRIYVKLATRKHEELGPTAMVTFTVE